MEKQDETKRFAYIDGLSTSQLKELLRTTFDSPSTENLEAILYILDVIEKRESEHSSMPSITVDEAWKAFQQYYNIPEGDSISLYPCHPSHNTKPDHQPSDPQPRRAKRFRKTFTLLIAIAILISGMVVAAQASSLDILGILGSWTKEAFQFLPGSDSASFTTPNSTRVSRDMLLTWCPDGYDASAIQLPGNTGGESTHPPFS